MAGTRKSASVHGDTLTYMYARSATMGAYTGADVKTTGTTVRMASRMGRPRTLAVSATKSTSSTSPTTAPTSAAAISSPHLDGIAASVACAAKPIAAPLMNRVLVY